MIDGCFASGHGCNAASQLLPLFEVAAVVVVAHRCCHLAGDLPENGRVALQFQMKIRLKVFAAVAADSDDYQMVSYCPLVLDGWPVNRVFEPFVVVASESIVLAVEVEVLLHASL